MSLAQHAMHQPHGLLPSATKITIVAISRYQAEVCFYIKGLNIAEKVQMMKQQLAHVLCDHRFSKLEDGTTTLGCLHKPGTKKIFLCKSLNFRYMRRACRVILVSGYEEPLNIPSRRLAFLRVPPALGLWTMDPKLFMKIFPVIYPLDNI